MLKFLFLFALSTLFANSPIFVGIAGGTGSGKTTLAENLHQAFPNSVLISQDSYYKDMSHLTFEERTQVNFDHPDSLEFSLLKQHLIALQNGMNVEVPVYNFGTHNRTMQTIRIDPAKIVIVEGILIFTIPEIRDLLDIKIFVDTDDDVRVLRRIERDLLERSREFHFAKEQYLNTVKPMHAAFVEPSKKYADVIVPKGGQNAIAVSLILAKLNEMVGQ